MSEKQDILNLVLSVVGYGSVGIGITMMYSAWYGAYEFGIYLGAGTFVFGIIVLLIWYMMKKKS